MKITKKELQEVINAAVKAKLATLSESTDFTAKRQLIYSAQNASMEFEKEIISALNLIPPDTMPPHLQQKYFQIAEQMKRGVVEVVAAAVGKFATLPRNDAGDKK